MAEDHFTRYNQTEWVVKSKRGRLSPLPNVYSMEAVTTITKKLLHGLTWNKILITLEKREMHVAVDKESYDLIDKEGMSVLQKDPLVFHNSIATVKNVAKEWISLLQKVYIQDLGTITDRELLQMCLTYKEYYKKVYGHYFTIIMLEKPLTEFLQNILKKRIDEKKSAEAFTTLTFTIDAMHPKNEERDRLQLALTCLKNSAYTQLFEKEVSEIEKELLQFPLLNDAIDTHTQKHFLLTRDYEDAVLTKSDFIQRIKESLSLGNVPERALEALLARKKNKEKIEMLERELKLTEEERNGFSIMRAGIYLKELRKKIVSQSLFYFDHVLKEICRRTGLDLRLARMLLPEDLEAVLIEKKEYASLLEARFNKSVYVVEDGVHHLFVGKEADALFNAVVKVDKTIREMKGLSGSAGVARGPARIIKHPSEFHKIQKGDVMVTIQAVPSFIEPLRKSVALVADGGTGITSHPATLAREVGIPCVFQTKVATEVIQDGDLVEVDGNTGFVKILEKFNRGKKVTNTGNHATFSTLNKKNFILLNDEPNMNLLTVGPILHGFNSSRAKAYIGASMGTAVVAYDHRRLHYYADQEEYKHFGKMAFEKLVDDKTLIRSFRYEMEETVARIHSFVKKLKRKKLRVQSPKMFDAFQFILQEYRNICTLGGIMLSCDLENYFLTNALLKELKDVIAAKRLKRSAQEYFTALTSFTDYSHEKKEKIALARLALKIKNKKVPQKNLKKELERIHETFCWSSHFYSGPAKTMKFYRQHFRALLKGETAKKYLQGVVKDEKEIIEKQKKYALELMLTQHQQHLVTLYRTIMYLKMLRRDLMSFLSYQILLLLEPLRRKLKLTQDEFQYITPVEMEGIIRGRAPPSREILQKRLSFCVYLYSEKEGEKILLGDEGVTFLNEHRVPDQQIRDTHEVKGMAAYVGTVTGKVAIVNTKEDMKKVKEGDILVSYATSPEILQAMEKAAGFVTDHGGATCHAAIVAREMKKPCIIGTKIATRMFKDGDVVTICGEEGIVRKSRVDKKNTFHERTASKGDDSEGYWIKNAEDHRVSLFPPYFWLLAAYFETPKITGIRVQGSALEMMNHSFNFILKMPHWRDAGAALTEKAVRDKKLFPKIRRLSIQYVDELVSFAETLAQKDFSKATNKQLNHWYQQLCQGLLKKWSVGVTHVMFDFDYTHVTDRLVAILEKKTDNVQEVLSVFVTPMEESALKKEEIAFLKIVALAQKLGVHHPRVKLLLNKHWKSYLWIQHSWEGTALPLEFFEQRLQQMIREKVHAEDELKTITMKRKNILKKQKTIEEKLRLTAEEKRLFAMGRGIVFLKAYRKELLFKVLCLVDPFLEEIAKRCKLTVAEFRFLLYDEVEKALLKGKDYQSIAQERMKHCVFVIEDGTQRMLIGTEAKTFSSNVHHETADPHQKVLKGMCAQPGSAEGIVKHISTPEDMKKFNAGDILVSAATNPMIVPAMERAGAIVTDEGGLTCHASIVSRELGVPCVIGTKVATKLLREGERVTVDATKGVVTRVDC